MMAAALDVGGPSQPRAPDLSTQAEAAADEALLAGGGSEDGEGLPYISSFETVIVGVR